MDKAELEQQSQLIEDMDKAQQAELVKQLTQEWLEDYQEAIIETLKTCPENVVMALRNQLVASEAFKTYLNRLIFNGKVAEEDLKKLLKPPEPDKNWFDNY